MKEELNSDGSMKGTTFSEKFNGKKVPYPSPKKGETYKQYRERVWKLSEEEGFHLGDLSWSDWTNYCIGAGYQDIDENSYIFKS